MRRWTFLVGIVASALLVAGPATLCMLIWMAVESRAGHPGIGGFLFTLGAALGLRSSRVIAAADPP